MTRGPQLTIYEGDIVIVLSVVREGEFGCQSISFTLYGGH
jgi:hypothetical protein